MEEQMENQVRQQFGQDHKVARPKYWSELDAEEKIERMRDQVKFLQCRVEWIGRTLSALVNHSHDPGGHPVHRVDGYNIASPVQGVLRGPEDRYF